MTLAWTCRIVPRGGRLLDLGELEQAVRKVGQQFSLRGVEATVEGTLSRAPDGAPLLQLGAGDVLRLAPLRRKVQWDPEARRAEPITAAERGAYGRLVAASGGAPQQFADDLVQMVA